MSDPNQPSPAKKKLRPPSLKGGDENLSSVKKSPMKRFMSPTISRAAKVNPVPRTKIPAADRNESPAKLASPRASSFNLNNDGFRDENEKERRNNGDNNNLITDGSSPIPSSNYLSVSRSDGDESLSSVKKSPMKHFLSPTANQLSRTRVLAERNESPSIKFVPTPPPPRASSFKLNNGGFRDENDKEWNHNTNIDTLITDDLSPMIPYNPASNYLSPRPKFLRYNPERRSQILRRRVKLKEEDVLDLEQDTTDTESDISPGNAAAAAPLSPAKDDEVDDAIEEDEFEEEDEGSSVFGRVFQFLLLLMVLIASTLYITSMNNLNPVEADYQEIQSCYPLVGFGRKIEVNGTCLLVGEGMMLRQQQHPVVAPSFLVDVEQKGDGEEEEAMEEVSGGMVVVELQKAEAMEIQEEEENFIDITEDENNEAPYTEVLHPAAMEVLEEERLMEEENFIDITEDETNEAPYKDVLHPAAVEVLEEERLMEVEQKGEEEEEKEKEEAMEEVSEGGILLVVDEHQPSEVVEIQEKEESFIDLEEVTEDGIDGAKEEESFIDVEQVSEDVIDEVTTPQNGKSMVDFIVLLYAAILASAAGLLVLLMMTMRKRRNVASRDNADRRSKSTLVRPSPPRALRNSSTAEEKNNEAAEKKSEAAVVQEQAESSCSTMASGKKGTSSINNNKNELNAEEASRSDSPVGFRQAESHCSTTTSGEKGTTSSTSSIIKRKKKQEEIGDAGTTTPLRRSTRIAASRGILSP